jgi:hypothetical protein
MELTDLQAVEEVEEPGHVALVHMPLLCLHHVLRACHHLTGLLLCVMWLRSWRRSASVEHRRSSSRPNGVQVDLM